MPQKQRAGPRSARSSAMLARLLCPLLLAAAASAADAVIEEIVCKVNSDIITRSELERDRKMAEAELRASEERYRFLFESNPLPMWVCDLETLRFLAVNETAVMHYGYSEDEFLAMTIRDIRPSADSTLTWRRTCSRSLTVSARVSRISARFPPTSR